MINSKCEKLCEKCVSKMQFEKMWKNAFQTCEKCEKCEKYEKCATCGKTWFSLILFLA
jgi:hypothetical protein